MRTITMQEVNKMNCNTFSKKDSSPRGIKIVNKNELMVDDKIIIDNYFTLITEKRRD